MIQKLPEPLRRFAPVIGIVLLLVVGYLAYGKFLGGAAGEVPAEASAAPTAVDLEAAADDKDNRKDDKVAGPVVTLGEALVVNLGDPGLRTTVRVAIELKVDEGTPVVAGADGAAPHLAEEALARDVAISTLGGLTSANLLAPTPREEVRKLLVRRLNRALPATLVMSAYFSELTVSDASTGAEAVDLEAAAKAATEEAAKAHEADDEAEADHEAEADDEAEADEETDAAADEEAESETDDEAKHASSTADEKTDTPAKSTKTSAHGEQGQ